MIAVTGAKAFARVTFAPGCFLPLMLLYCTDAHTDRRRRRRYPALRAAADVSCGESVVLARAIKIGGGVVALAGPRLQVLR